MRREVVLCVLQVSGSNAYTHSGGVSAAALHTPMSPAPQPYHRPPRPHLGNYAHTRAP